MDERAEFEKRLTRVREAMRDQGLQALLVYDSGRHNFLRMNYVAYLTDFISVGPETILVVPFGQAPVLYLTPPWDLPRAQEESAVGATCDRWRIVDALGEDAGQGRTHRPRSDACRFAR